MQNQRAQIVKKNKPEFVQSAENKERRGWSNARYGGGKEAQKVNLAIFHAGTMFAVCLYILVSSIVALEQSEFCWVGEFHKNVCQRGAEVEGGASDDQHRGYGRAEYPVLAIGRDLCDLSQ